MYKKAGVANLGSAAWIFTFLSWSIYIILVPSAYISEHDPRYYTDPRAYIDTFATCGALFAPIPPVITFAVWHGIDQRRRAFSRVPARLTLLGLGIAAVICLSVTVIRTNTAVETHALLGQSPFMAVGVWLALASLKVFRQMTLPRIISIAGFLAGVSWMLWMWILLLGWVNYDADRISWLYGSISIIAWAAAMFVFAAAWGLWLLRNDSQTVSANPA